MTENLNEAISLDQAVEQMWQQPEADDTPAETEVTEETQEVEPEVAAGEAEDGETQEPDEVDDPEFEVDTVDGKKKLKLSQIKDSVMLKADYTRKTMALAEDRKVAEREKAEASQLKQQLAEALQVWAIPTEQEPDWHSLAKTVPPQEFNLRRVEWEARQQKAMRAREQFQALQEHQQQETIRTEYAKLIDAIPEWKDEAKFKAAAQKMQTGSTEYGFTPEEVAGIVDHRMVRVLHDAIRYRELQKGAPAVTKKVAQAPTTLKPGAKPDQNASSEAARQKQRARLKQTGSVDDALALLFR
jgi:hypothetical protein